MKRRLSSRFPNGFDPSGDSIPPLPLNASELVAGGSIPPLPPSKYSSNTSLPSQLGNGSSPSKSSTKLAVTDQQYPQQQGQSQLQIPGSGRHHLNHQPSFDNLAASASLPPTNDPDILALRNPNLDAKAYISSKLSTASDVEISKFTDKIERLKDQVAIDRKNMVYGNYKTFLSVGSQITVLSSELQTLRKLINDLHVATTAMKQDAEVTLSATESSSSTASLALTGSSIDSDSSSLPLPLPRGLNSGARNNRNSVLVLESMWAQDLTGLLRSVEGAQKYLPPIPGRHVVEESSGWDQLNAATWKPWQPVKVYLLNDYLLIAVRKRSRNGDLLAVSQSSQTWVADQCWPLTDIQIKDLSKLDYGSEAPPHGFAVHKDRSVYVYKHNDPNLANKFFRAYNRLPKEVRSGYGRRDKSSGYDSQQARSRESVYGKANNGPKFGKEKKGHKHSVSMDIAERTQVLRDIDTLINELDVKIAHRNFAEAVKIIERHNREVADVREVSAAAVAAAQAASATSAIGGSISGPSGAKGRPSVAASFSTPQGQQTASVIDIKVLRAQILKIKLDQRSKEIADTLLGAVTQDYLGPGEVKQHIQMLIRLRQGEAVKKAFLSSRRQSILKRVKSVEFKGDIPSFISQIVTIHFRMVRSTVEIYQACFPSSSQASTVVEWARNEVEDYVVLFARQLYNIPQDSDTYKRCVESTKEQAVQLKNVGLNMDFLLNYVYGGSDAISPPITAAI